MFIKITVDTPRKHEETIVSEVRSIVRIGDGYAIGNGTDFVRYHRKEDSFGGKFRINRRFPEADYGHIYTVEFTNGDFEHWCVEARGLDLFNDNGEKVFSLPSSLGHGQFTVKDLKERLDQEFKQWCRDTRIEPKHEREFGRQYFEGQDLRPRNERYDVVESEATETVSDAIPANEGETTKPTDQPLKQSNVKQENGFNPRPPNREGDAVHSVG